MASITSVTLPQFWPNNVSVWFALVEASFEVAPRKITASATKYFHVLRMLSSEVASEVSDILMSPDPDDPYQKLKEALIARMTASSTQRLKQLLSGEELGDRKPSQLLRRMRQLVDKSQIADATLREIFIQRLPVHVQAILAAQDSLTLEQTAELADKIIENAPVASGVSKDGSALAAAQASSDLNTKYEELSVKLDKVVARLDQMQRSNGGYRRGGYRRNRSRSRSRNDGLKNQNDEGMCFYHSRFKDRARKCIKPCNYESENKKWD